MTQIIIHEDFMKLEINKWNNITEAVFEAYSEKRKCKGSDEPLTIPANENFYTAIFPKKKKGTPRCPDCKKFMAKSGIRRGKQRWECKKCKRRITGDFINAEEKKEHSKSKRKYTKRHKKPFQEVEKENPEEKLKNKVRTPANTALFLTWLIRRNKKRFSISDFTRQYPYISKESAIKIIQHQIKLKRILQKSQDEFLTQEALNEKRE